MKPQLVGCQTCGAVFIADRVSVTLNDTQQVYRGMACTSCKHGTTYVAIRLEGEKK